MFQPAFILYVLFCCLVASFGIRRRIGFTGFFLIAFVLTPPLTLLLLLLTRPAVEK